MTNVKKFKARAICLIVMAVMLFGMFPFAAFAAANNVTGNELVANKDGTTGNAGKIEKYQLNLTKKTEDGNSYIVAAPEENKTDNRFSLKNYSVSPNAYYAPQSAEKTMLWSMDILVPSTSKDGFEKIIFATTAQAALAEEVNMEKIGSYDEWHTLSLIYQPGTNGEKRLGTSSLFIDGKYISSKDLGNISSNGGGNEYRTRIMSNASSPIYLDNILLAEVETFTPPCVSSGINAESYVITGYGDNVTAGDEKQAMASALGINADNITIKSASGETVSDESFVAPGMKAVTEVNVSTTSFTDAKTYNVEYTFGVPYCKVLTSVINPATSEVARYFYDQVDVELKIEKGTLKSDTSDTYVAGTTKEMVTDKDTNEPVRISRFEILPKDGSSSVNCKIDNVMILSADMYIAAGDMQYFDYVEFKADGSSISYQLPVSELKPGEWNKILYVLYNDNGIYCGDLYLNGELKKAGFNGGKVRTADLRFCVKFNTKSKKFYIDNLYVATADSFSGPKISTDEYVASVIGGENGRIDGYKDMTVGAIKTASGLGGKVYTEDGTEVTDESVKAEKGMYFVAEKDLSDTSKYGFYAGKYTYKYVLKTAGYSFGAWSAKLGDTALTDNTYSSGGTLTVECGVENFLAAPVNGIAILAEFDSDGNLAGIRNTQNFSVAKGGTDKISLTYGIPNDTTGTFKAFVWNSYDEIMPLKDMLTISHK